MPKTFAPIIKKQKQKKNKKKTKTTGYVHNVSLTNHPEKFVTSEQGVHTQTTE